MDPVIQRMEQRLSPLPIPSLTGFDSLPTFTTAESVFLLFDKLTRRQKKLHSDNDHLGLLVLEADASKFMSGPVQDVVRCELNSRREAFYNDVVSEVEKLRDVRRSFVDRKVFERMDTKEVQDAEIRWNRKVKKYESSLDQLLAVESLYRFREAYVLLWRNAVTPNNNFERIHRFIKKTWPAFKPAMNNMEPNGTNESCKSNLATSEGTPRFVAEFCDSGSALYPRVMVALGFEDMSPCLTLDQLIDLAFMASGDRRAGGDKITDTIQRLYPHIGKKIDVRDSVLRKLKDRLNDQDGSVKVIRHMEHELQPECENNHFLELYSRNDLAAVYYSRTDSLPFYMPNRGPGCFPRLP